MGQILNAYPDDLERRKNLESEEIGVWLQIEQILNEHNMELEPYLKDGLPEVRLVKVT